MTAATAHGGAAPAAERGEPTPVREEGWRTFWITAIAVFMVSLDAMIVVAAFPTFREHFHHAPPWLLSWILNGYTIVYAALLVPAGRWSDLRGRRRAFLQGLVVFTGASVVCGMASSAGVLIAARALQAAGAALLTPATLALILQAFPVERRSVAVGLWSATGALGAALGPVAGSWIVDMISWPAIFFINLPIGLAAFWLGRTHLVESTNDRDRTPPDLPGSLLLIAGVGAICFGIVWSPASGWADGTNGTALAIGLMTLAGFVAWARLHGPNAMDLSLFEDRNYRMANLATFVFGAALGMMFLSFFLFTTSVWRYSQSLAGLAVTPGPLMVIPVAIVAGRLAVRLGHRTLLMLGGALFACANLWYFLRIGAEPAYLASWLPGQLVSGIAVGLVLPSLSSTAVAGLDPARFGVGSAINSAVRQLGSAFGVAVTIAILGQMGGGLPAFRSIYLVLAASGVATAVLMMRLESRPRQG